MRPTKRCRPSEGLLLRLKQSGLFDPDASGCLPRSASWSSLQKLLDRRVWNTGDFFSGPHRAEAEHAAENGNNVRHVRRRQVQRWLDDRIDKAEAADPSDERAPTSDE